MTSGRPTPNGVLVDIEALILGSAALADLEPRLGDITTEWMVVNSDLISTGRLKSQRAGLDPVADARLGSIIAQVHFRTRDARWRPLIGSATLTGNTVRERGSRKAARPRFAVTATLQLRLRLAFGLGAKTDLLTVLIGRADEWMTVRTVAALAGYTERAAREALADLHEAGILEHSDGPTARYLLRAVLWTHLEGMLSPDRAGAASTPPRWCRFDSAYAFVSRWRHNTRDMNPATAASQAYVLSVWARELMAQFWPLFLEIGVTREPKASPTDDPWGACAHSFDRLADWFENA